jgi:hypothetical protein
VAAKTKTAEEAMERAQQEAAAAKEERERKEAKRQEDRAKKLEENRLMAEAKVKAELEAARVERERTLSELRSNAKTISEYLVSESLSPSSPQMQVILASLKDLDLQEVAYGMESYGQAVRNETFFHTLLAAANDLQMSASMAATTLQRKVTALVSASEDAAPEQLEHLVGATMNEAVRVFLQHKSDAETFAAMEAPELMRKYMGPSLDFFTTRVIPSGFDTELMERMHDCTTYLQVLNSMKEFRSNLSSAHTFINATSKVEGKLLELSSGMTNRAVELALRMAYVETLSLSEASQDFISRVEPVVERLSCASGACGARLGLGLLMAAVAYLVSGRF